MVKKVILYFFLLSFLGCKPTSIEFENKHKIAIGPNDKGSQTSPYVVRYKQGPDIPTYPSKKPPLTQIDGVERYNTSNNESSDDEIIGIILDKIKVLMDKKLVEVKSIFNVLLLLIICFLGICLILIHWIVRFIDWLTPNWKLGRTFIIVLIMLILTLVVVYI